MNKYLLTFIDLSNSIVSDSMLEFSIITFITILFFVFYYSIGLKMYGNKKRFSITYKIVSLLIYFLTILFVSESNFVYLILFLYSIYILVYKRIKKPKISLESLIGKNHFDFKEVKIDDKDFIKKSFDIFKNVSYSWSNLDMYPSKDILSNELYSIYESQADLLYLKQQRNVMNNIEFVKAKIKDITKGKNEDKIIVVMEIKCRDYLISTVDNKVLKGHPSFLMDYIYELTFIRKKEIKKSNVCPECKAILPRKFNKVKCPYCNSLVKTYNYKYILCKKNLLKQSAKKD